MPLSAVRLKTQLQTLQGAGQALPRAVRQRLEYSLGADLNQVRIHTHAQAAALTHALHADALAVGRDVFFSSGAYQPATPHGLRLLAHEVEHTIQQANAHPKGRPLGAGLRLGATYDEWEHAADRAADRVLAGVPAPTARRAPQPTAPQLIQRHASFEHRLLGDAPTDELVAIANKEPNYLQKVLMEREFLWMWHQNPEQVTEQMINQACPWIRTLRLKNSNLLVTYGELNTLPDYLPNFQSFDTTPKDILLPILQFVRQEGYQRMNQMLCDCAPGSLSAKPLFQGAASAFSNPGLLNTLISTNSLDALTANRGIHKADHYNGLLARNACHFAPFSWYRWQASYLIARNEALLAYQNRNDSAQCALHTYNAWIAHGYADHFLQDSFAAGHLINKTLVMQWFLEWAKDQRTVPVADWDLLKKMVVDSQPNLAGTNLYASTFSVGPSNDPQTVEELSPYSARTQGPHLSSVDGQDIQYVYQHHYLTFLNGIVAQSAGATVHDHYNKKSLWVASQAHPGAFQVWGDETFLNGGDGVRIASETAQQSQQSILDLLNTGATDITVTYLSSQFPTQVRNKADHLVSLLDWHNTDLKTYCFNTLFDEVYARTLRTKPHIGHISQDQSSGDHDFKSVWNKNLSNANSKLPGLLNVYGTLFTGAGGYLSRFNPTTGDSAGAGTSLSNASGKGVTLAASGLTLFAGSYGYGYAYNLNDFTQRWSKRFPAGDQSTTDVLYRSFVGPTPAVYLFMACKGYIFQHDPDTGAVQQQAKIGAFSEGNVGYDRIRLSMENQQVLYGGTRGWAVALWANSLAQKWVTQLTDAGTNLVNIEDMLTVVYAGANGYLYQLDPIYGAILNRYDFTSYKLNGKNPTRGEVYLAHNAQYLYAACQGWVLAFNLTDFTLQWGVQLTNSVSGNTHLLTLQNNYLYAAASGYVFQLDLANGAIVHTCHLTHIGAHEVTLSTNGDYLHCGGYGVVEAVSLDLS